VAGLILESDAAVDEGLSLVAQEYKVPVLLPAGPLRSGSEFLFTTGMTPTAQGEALAQFATGEPLKARSVLVVVGGGKDHAAGNEARRALAKAFATECGKLGGIAIRELLYQDASQLKALLDQAQTQRPDAILLACPAAELSALKQAGLGKETAVLWGAEEGGLKTLQADQVDCAVYIASAFVTDATEATKQFSTRFREHFGEPADVQAALAYDNGRLLFQAMRRATTFEGPAVRQALAGIKDFAGLTGLVSVRDQQVCRPVFIVRIEKGSAETVKRIAPPADPALGTTRRPVE
jgi:branched-chain amino acid transport system substrate-binding protein